MGVAVSGHVVGVGGAGGRCVTDKCQRADEASSCHQQQQHASTGARHLLSSWQRCHSSTDHVCNAGVVIAINERARHATGTALARGVALSSARAGQSHGQARKPRPLLLPWLSARHLYSPAAIVSDILA